MALMMMPQQGRRDCNVSGNQLSRKSESAPRRPGVTSRVRGLGPPPSQAQLSAAVIQALALTIPTVGLRGSSSGIPAADLPVAHSDNMIWPRHGAAAAEPPGQPGRRPGRASVGLPAGYYGPGVSHTAPCSQSVTAGQAQTQSGAGAVPDSR